MARRAVFLDTSFIIAVENQLDPHYGRAVALGRAHEAAGSELVLHWGIVLEVGDGFAPASRRERGVQILQVITSRPEYRICPLVPSLAEGALSLFYARPDKDWGLTDCVSFELMRREGLQEALTADAHFRQAGFTALLLDEAAP